MQKKEKKATYLTRTSRVLLLSIFPWMMLAHWNKRCLCFPAGFSFSDHLLLFGPSLCLLSLAFKCAC